MVRMNCVGSDRALAIIRRGRDVWARDPCETFLCLIYCVSRGVMIWLAIWRKMSTSLEDCSTV